ncbi:hypothetical protein BYT27DRAFT_7255031 [Phlegmacium glaucopus]|nr:hypothetical protein BYT27DRAFT_7255031 [Phlegmacium glaucopus]
MQAHHPKRKSFRPAVFVCNVPGCSKACTTARGLRQHRDIKHAIPAALLFPANPYPSLSESDNSEPSLNSPLRTPPSPTFSSRRSPRRTPTGSPIFAPRSPRPLISNGLRIERHPLLDGVPCDSAGNDLETGSPPPPPKPRAEDDYSPFMSRAEFELAEFLFVHEEMSAGKVDKLINILGALYDDTPPVSGHKELYSIIDSIKQGDIPWDSFSVSYDGERPAEGRPQPPWMDQKYEVWFRDPLKVMENQIGNPDFKDHIDYAPKRIFRKDKRRYRDLMSGNWAWEQADKIGEDVTTHGATFAPVVLGSDKTTVSVATGQNDFYPLYASLGNVHNSVRRAHRNAVALIGFLAIPKTTREYSDKADFRKFRRQLFHSSLEHILSSLRLHMTTPCVTLCSDGHYRRVIYGLGPYIADYPEQALLACIVQNWCPKCTASPDNLDGGGGLRSRVHTNVLLESGAIDIKELWDDYGIVGDLIPFTNNFPRADIHELLSPDLLHQIIKGTFKDHLVDWVEQYIKDTYQKSRADAILADIDRRCEHYLQVYLPAIAGHVPTQMVQAVASLIHFCYLVRRNVIDEDALSEINIALSRFHAQREIFREVNVRPEGFSLPRQHSLSHYPFLITQFGAPNGLCSSITESKHIKAVKKPYRRSSRNKPLGQMLVTNQRIDKIAAARVDFEARGMLDGPNVAGNIASLLSLRDEAPDIIRPRADEGDEGRGLEERNRDDVGAVDEPESQAEVKLARTYICQLPRDIYLLARAVKQPQLPLLARRFLFDTLNPESDVPASRLPAAELPDIPGKVYVYSSARAVFYAPSDLSGIGGMRHERIRSVRSWYGGAPRRDCVFVGNTDSDAPGFEGLLVARVFLFFSFKHEGITYPCALVHWFSTVGDGPDDETGMWMVEPDFQRGQQVLEVIHLDSILRGAHLIGVAGSQFLPSDPLFNFSRSLDAFKTFYVNKYVDHHAHEIAF